MMLSKDMESLNRRMEAFMKANLRTASERGKADSSNQAGSLMREDFAMVNSKARANLHRKGSSLMMETSVRE